MEATIGQPAEPNLFLRVWTAPQATVRYLIQTDSNRHVLQLAMAGGVAQSMSQAMEASVGDRVELPTILMLSLMIGSLYGLVALYVGAALIAWTGRIMGGRGSQAHLRTAIAWSFVPWAVFLPIMGLAFTVVGKLPFVSEEAMASVPIHPLAPFVLLGLAVLLIGVAIWSFVLLLKMIGEVQGFSAWMAWGNLIFCVVPIMVVGIFVAVLSSIVTG